MLKGPGLYNPINNPNRLKKELYSLAEKLERDRLLNQLELKDLRARLG